MFEQTDDMQYRKHIGGREYLLIDAVMDASYEDKDFPEDCYAVFSGTIDLDCYSQEEVKCIVASYYPSYEQFLEAYQGISEEEIDGLIAEMIFETELTDNTFHGHYTEKAADTFMDYWMEDMEKSLNGLAEQEEQEEPSYEI